MVKVCKDDILLNRVTHAHHNNIQVRYHKSCYLADSKQSSDVNNSSNRQSIPLFSEVLGDGTFADLSQGHTDHKQKTVTEAANIIAREAKAQSMKSLLHSVSHNAANNIIPHMLRVFMSTLFGCQTDDLSPQPLSLAQNILYTIARVRTPKHIALASELRKLSGSKKIINLISDFGHCVQYIDALRLETSSANKVLASISSTKVFVPENIARGQYIFGAADNIDFGNCTPDGKGTTHGINMILYQPGGWLPEYQRTGQTADFQTPAPTSHLRRSVYAHKCRWNEKTVKVSRESFV